MGSGKHGLLHFGHKKGPRHYFIVTSFSASWHSFRNLSFSLDCPTPIPLWVVVASIIGAVVGLGILVLIAIKIIIIVIQRIEYKKFIENIKNQPWGQVKLGHKRQSLENLFYTKSFKIFPRAKIQSTDGQTLATMYQQHNIGQGTKLRTTEIKSIFFTASITHAKIQGLTFF